MKDLDLIKKLAWTFHKSTGVELDDLIQEAAYAYLKAKKEFKPEKGKFSVFVWICMTNHLKNYLNEIRPNLRKNINLVSFEDVSYAPSYTPSFLFESLGKEAQQIVNIIFTSPKLYYTLDPAQAKKRIIKVMKNKGWDMPAICQGIYDLIIIFS